jgi:centrosomal protein CEP135
MDPELQKRYFDLRKQLSSLNYSTNFGLDAVDVIQQLFGDLISTTESYTQLQEKEYELSQDLSLAQAQLFPLKKENAKISRENQQLHMDTVKLREELTDHQDTLVARVKELEDQLKEVTFLCSCKDESLRKGEQQRIRLREAYEQLASTSLLSGA